jgi:hypothetical protein
MDIDAGGQSMQATVRSAATLGAVFARSGDGLRVTMTVEDLDARVANPMASVSADESGVKGALVFTMDRRGAVTLVSQPEVAGETAQFFQPLSMAHGLFPRLPGRAAGVGESWTDTIRIDGDQGPGSVQSVMVVQYTVAGDTLVGGRSLVKIDLKATSEASVRGVTTGMDFTQSITGTQEGWVLWDQQRSLMVESYATNDGRGTMDVSAAPFPLGVRIRSTSRVKLHDGM